MNGTCVPINDISDLETYWTPLIDIFFRHLYSLPPGTCMYPELC